MSRYWRQELNPYIDYGINGDIYHFGVHSGASLIEIANYVCSTERHIGFDSFEGLPLDPSEPLWFPEWNPGLMNVQDYFHVGSISEAIEKVSENIKNNTQANFFLIPGFFEDCLNDELVLSMQLKPAIYIDIDCDLYSSTLTCLDFMARNKLIISGTVIGFDDWKETPGWQTNQSGESKAWLETCQKYSIDFEHLYEDQANTNSYWVVKINSVGVSI